MWRLRNKFFFVFSALDDLRNHLENPDSTVEMKFLLLEQKYLEHLSRGNSIDALKVNILLEIQSRSNFSQVQ